METVKVKIKSSFGNWKVCAVFPSGETKEYLTRGTIEKIALAEWLRGKSYPDGWQRDTVVARAITWLYEKEHQEFNFDYVQFFDFFPFQFKEEPIL